MAFLGYLPKLKRGLGIASGAHFLFFLYFLIIWIKVMFQMGQQKNRQNLLLKFD